MDLVLFSCAHKLAARLISAGQKTPAKQSSRKQGGMFTFRSSALTDFHTHQKETNVIINLKKKKSTQETSFRILDM